MSDTEVLDGVFVRRSGPRARTKIVCLHGWADSGLLFTPLFETDLTRDFELVAVDLPGFGESPRQAGMGTIAANGDAVASLVRQISPDSPVGLVGHSIAGAIAVAAVERLPAAVLGVFSIEGNLCEADTFFTARAAHWDEPDAFKAQFLEELRKLERGRPIFRRYRASAVMADAATMWELGRDAKRASEGNALGHAYAGLGVPNLYYWSRGNTPESTQDFIRTSGIANLVFTDASHWPTVDAPGRTAGAIRGFFSPLLS
jgi:pimeloyl-ACP methyl ester carboxylesterase